MRLSLDKVSEIKKQFMAEHPEIFNRKVRAGCGISQVKLLDESAREDKENFCIVVSTQVALPSEISLPSRYKGVRVFVMFIGRIRALSPKLSKQKGER